MDSVKLCAMLFATGCFLSICMALDCNWKTQYEHTGKCCQKCPLGEFPIQHCNNNIQSVCKKCTNKNEHCFCNNTLCDDVTCSKCSPNKWCTPGEKLMRTGSFKFGYICEPCPTQTYYDEEGNICKPMLDCRNLGLPVIFPGNMTHNARCGCQGPSNGMMVGLAIIGLISLAMLIYLCILRAREQRRKKKYDPTSSSLKVPNDECGYKLSKEEIGEMETLRVLATQTQKQIRGEPTILKLQDETVEGE